MKSFRFSIRTLVFAVALVAFDCAFATSFGMRSTVGLGMAELGSLGMINVLAITGYRRLVRGSAKSPFFVGFAFFGAVAVLVWISGCLMVDDEILEAFGLWFSQIPELVPFFEQAQDTMAEEPPSILATVYIVLVGEGSFVVLTTLTLLVFALAGGWLGRRLAAALKKPARGVIGEILGGVKT